MAQPHSLWIFRIGDSGFVVKLSLSELRFVALGLFGYELRVGKVVDSH